jgi:hypothetical protein
MTFDILECNSYDSCKNSVSNSENQKCYLCRLAPGNETLERDYFKPVIPGGKHPQLFKEKNDKQFKIRTEKIAKRQNRSKPKMKISWKAANAEKNTENNIIKATRNSGRTSRDGDHVVLNGVINLDTKLQTTMVDPVCKLAELDKAVVDAKRGGALTGGLVVRNKYGVGIVMMHEEDFGKYILSRII